MKRIVLIILVLTFYSCSIWLVPPAQQKKYKFCYIENTKVDIESIVNIKGMFFPIASIKSIDTINSSNEGYYLPIYLFYKNGMTTKNPTSPWVIPKEDFPKSWYNHGSTWGQYTLNKDTIKSRYISKPGGQTNYVHDVWFKVINKNTIQQLFGFKDGGTIEVGKIYKFVSYDSLPNPQKAWLMKEKWFWCNEKDWKRYMNNVNN